VEAAWLPERAALKLTVRRELPAGEAVELEIQGAPHRTPPRTCTHRVRASKGLR